jgi:hypothetical protein
VIFFQKNIAEGTPFGMVGLCSANERHIRQVIQSHKMAVAFFFLTLFLIFLALTIAMSVGDQEA